MGEVHKVYEKGDIVKAKTYNYINKQGVMTFVKSHQKKVVGKVTKASYDVATGMNYIVAPEDKNVLKEISKQNLIYVNEFDLTY